MKDYAHLNMDFMTKDEEEKLLNSKIVHIEISSRRIRVRNNVSKVTFGIFIDQEPYVVFFRTTSYGIEKKIISNNVKSIKDIKSLIKYIKNHRDLVLYHMFKSSEKYTFSMHEKLKIKAIAQNK